MVHLIYRTLSGIRAARLKSAGVFLWRWNCVVALALFAAVGLAVLDDYGAGPDEWHQWRIGARALDYILGDADELLDDHNRYYGVAFELPLSVIERVLGLERSREIYLTRHLLTHAFHLVGGLFAWALALRMFGSRTLALVAMLTFLLHPRIYAHSFFNTKDAPFLSMFMIALYAVHRAFGKNSVGAFACAGVAVGLLANIRVMGAALFPAVVVMLLCDMAAALWARRGARRPALSAAAFAVAAPLTLYATYPIMWVEGPLALLDAFRTLSDHPFQTFVLFQGEMVHNSALPPHYLPTWIAITTPPLTLALAAAGIGATLWAAARRPADAFGNSETRFRLMLAAALALALAAVAAFSPHMVNGWRHFFFLYAPICLLAVCGLDALASAAAAWTERARRRIGRISPAAARAAIYAAAVLGIGVTVAEMAAIHPHQLVYFNAFVDRRTPEYLRTQYEMGAIGPSLLEGMRWLLARYPDSAPSVRSASKARWLLSERENGALRSAGDRTDPDFVVFNSNQLEERFAPYAYTRRVYDNAIMSVAAVNLDMVDDETSAPYRRLYEDATTGALGEPMARADFDVWLDRYGEALVYARDDCERHEDADFNFAVNVAPVFSDDLPMSSARFHFADRGVRFGGKCLMRFPLPDFPVRAVQVGALTERGMSVWGETTIQPDAETLSWHRSEYARLSKLEPAVRADFDAYLDGEALVYLKEDCAESDVRGRFMLSVWAADADDLPGESRARGHESLNFDFAQHGLIFDGMCVAWRVLPEYPIRAIDLGQWGGDGDDWSARLVRAPDGTLTDARLETYRRAADGEMGEPLVESAFDVYLDGESLIYVKAPCVENDTRGRFLVSVYPENAADLSASHKAKGLTHDSLNFDFADRGAALGGKCVARLDLPGYAIDRLQLGQWIPGGETLWSETAAMPRR